MRTDGKENVILDDDNDGLSNIDELNLYNTDPPNPDSDGDGLSDGDEVITTVISSMIVMAMGWMTGLRLQTPFTDRY